MTGFALNLDLSLYFDDLRKFSCVFVNPSKFKTVHDVEIHIKALFNLEDICLTHKKFLIPKFEEIELLRQYEVLRVQKCDFYDIQIHKNKRVNPSCDQAALNLIQYERTIDLSCRPKQRFKINICQNRCTSGTSSSPYIERSVINLPHATTAASNSEDRNLIQPKEKSKKKKHEMQKCSSNANENTGTSNENILDMSVTKGKRKRYENCFLSNGDENLNSIVPYGESNTILENGHESSTNESLKKHKKRLKLSQSLNEDVEYFTAKNVSEKVKKHKKSKKNDSLSEGSIADLSNVVIDQSDFLNDENKLIYNSTINHDYPKKKKHKKSKEPVKFVESVSLKVHDQSRFTEANQPNDNGNFDEVNDFSSLSDVSREVVCNKNRYLEEVRNISKIHGSTSEESNDTSIASAKKNENIETYGDECSNNGEERTTLEQDCSSPSSCKRKRNRKRSKKKQRGRSHLLGVGEILQNLNAQNITKPKPVPLGSGKHIFFGDDTEAQVNIPITNNQTHETPTILKDVAEESNDIVNKAETDTSSPQADWQRNLLSLASSSSRPIVFHRSSSSVSSEKSVQQNVPSNTPVESPKADCSTNKCSGEIENNKEKLGKDNSNLERCESETVVLNRSKEIAQTEVKKLLDVGLPSMTDIENIILTNYPIIDKLVAEDLILFKILKLSENNEPGVSKPILAKVNNSTTFPEKIYLQILEGCEECQSCNRNSESGEGFVIELRWCDMLEPRLFYP